MSFNGVTYSVSYGPANWFKIMDPVAVVSDTLNFGLPVGHKGYVMADNSAAGQALTHMIRVPDVNLNVWVPRCDIEPWDEYLDKSINDAIHTHKINDALDRKDAAAFEAVTNETQLPPKG